MHSKVVEPDMSYDEESFWTGVVLGQQLKGWASAGQGGALSEIEVQSGVADFVEKPADGFYGIGKVLVKGDPDLQAGNIRKGVNIFGVVGSYDPTPNLMAGTVTIRNNGVTTVYPSRGYDGLTQVRVTTEVPTDLVLQTKSVTPGAGDKVVTPDTAQGYTALSSVRVYGDGNLRGEYIREGISIFGVAGTYKQTIEVQAKLQSKSVTPGRSAQYVYPDTGYDGLTYVYVSGDSALTAGNIRKGVSIFGVTGEYEVTQIVDAKLHSKSVTLNRGSTTVYPDSGYNGLSSVTVNWDSDIVAGNIRNGVTIFGVKGTYESPMKSVTVIPSQDRQLILPTDGYFGFNEIIVEPAPPSGSYGEGYDVGYAEGVASQQELIERLYAQIDNLTAERDAAYENGYDAGYDVGHNAGYNEGYDTGYSRGYSDGVAKGFVEVGTQSAVYDEPADVIRLKLENGYEEALTFDVSSGKVVGFTDSNGNYVRLEVDLDG